MRVSRWIGQDVESLLDVGCNAGIWLADCARQYPGALLAGVEINETALANARGRLPGADLRQAGVEALPFPDRSFQYVTCTEVLEHIPPALQSTAFREMRRVLKPGGRLILTVPHAGWFAWLDSNNVRFRLPRLYRWVIGRGLRDGVYDAVSRDVEWHHHFNISELLALAGDGWETVAVRYGGLVVYPLMDWISWPFYKLRAHDHRLRQLFERFGACDYDINYGRASYGVLLALERRDR
jgi:SAM-dependent methyltransferase